MTAGRPPQEDGLQISIPAYFAPLRNVILQAAGYIRVTDPKLSSEVMEELERFERVLAGPIRATLLGADP